MTEETAAPVEGQAAPVEGAQDAAPPSWLDGLDDDKKGYIEAKGFKDPGAVIESYRNLEKLRGVPEDRLLKLPEKMDGADLSPIYDKLGRPESADKYTRVLGEGFNDDAFKGIAAKAHELGLNDAQFKGLQEITGNMAAQVQEQMDATAAAEFDAWKSKNDQGFKDAARVMAQVGVSEEQLEGILSGNKAALYDFLAKFGAKTAESPVIQGEQPGGDFGMSPASARQKINELMADKAFMDAYTSTNAKVRGPAIARIETLHKAAAKGA